jgi:hypothetical protein
LFEVDREGRFYEVPTPHVDHLLAAPHVFIGRTESRCSPRTPRPSAWMHWEGLP